MLSCGADKAATPVVRNPLRMQQTAPLAGSGARMPTMPTIHRTPDAPVESAAPTTPAAPTRPAATVVPTIVLPPQSDDSAPTSAADARPPLSRTTNVLILGSDRRPRDPNWRTDVMMIVALDFANNAAGVISIPRDLYVDEIPGHQGNRINVIDYLGEQDGAGRGPQLLASIIEERMGVPIHRYLRFEFTSFKEVVNALGGIEVQIDCNIHEFLEEEALFISRTQGTYRLNGDEALSYVRSRRVGGDLERVRRQQRFAWAVRRQLLSENWLPQLPALYTALDDAVVTDIGVVEAVQFTRFALGLSEEEIHGFVIAPPDLVREGWQRGMFVFMPDWAAIAARVQTVFERPPFIETNTVGPSGDRSVCP